MNGNLAVYVIWGIGCIVLAARALAGRRMPLNRLWKPALAWVAIFGILTALVMLMNGRH